MLFNKRASLEISIQAIVIVVLAMTLLGLGLGFIKGMFRDISKVSESTFEKITDQLQKDLIDSDEELIFSQSKITIERGKSELLAWGIKNEGNQELKYWAEFTFVKCPSECEQSVDAIGDEITEYLNNEWFTFRYNQDGVNIDQLYTVDIADSEVERVDLTIPKSGVETGLYLIQFSVYDQNAELDNKLYASTDIFITVT